MSKWIRHPLFRVALSVLLLTLGMLPIEGQLFTSFFRPFLAALALAAVGAPIFVRAVRGILRLDFLDETFLMLLAAVGAFLLRDYAEAVAVLAFFTVGETFEHHATRKSRASIKSLMAIRPDEATVLRDGAECCVDAEDVAVGETLILRTGERVPLDGTVLSGTASIDASALTGESLPYTVSVGDTLESGMLILDGLVNLRADRVADESAAARILSMVEDATENKAREEAFITRFSRYYTPIVVGLAVLLAVLPAVFGWLALAESVRRALTFLVISCPCALVISVPMAFFGGIGAAARCGILFKGGNVFAPLARATTFAFDKTGTLTTGELSIVEIAPVSISADELLSLAAGAEYASSHPFARALKAAVPNASIPTATHEHAGMGMEVNLSGARVLVGNARLLSHFGIARPTASGASLFVARDGEYLGYIRFADSLRHEAKEAIAALRTDGVNSLCMLSGDRTEHVRTVAAELGLDAAFGDLLPDDKYRKMGELIQNSSGVVYVGDGINDCPTLALADVGVAMGLGGQESAIESADLVMMSDDLSRLPLARRIARRTLRIAKQNIAFALGVKLAVLILGALGYANMWLSVFADVGVSILAILNAMRALKAPK